jgi:DNA polymerase-1
MTEHKPVALGFDIETASADRLYGETHDGGPFVRLSGAIEEHGQTGMSGDAAQCVRALYAADAVYGHNIFRFDIPALARHAGADYDALAAKAWDTAILERLVDPPGAKHVTKAGYYGLDETAHRYGHAGKSDDLKGLALQWGPFLACEGCDLQGKTTDHPKHESTCTRKKIVTVVGPGDARPGRMTRTERIDIGFERIPQDDSEYRDYLRGDLEATQHVQRSVFRRVTDWNYARREMRIAAFQNRMTFNGWRVDRGDLARRVEREDARRAAAVKRLNEDYGVPLTKADGKPSASPWATTGGRAALESAFSTLGARYVPRTENGLLALGKDQLGDGWWVNPKGRRVPGMTHPSAYGLVPAVVELCGVLREATGATAKYAEIARYVTREGRVHGGIGEDQASGRWAMTKPSLTNLGKRGAKVEQRTPFVPDWGHVLIAVDASQVDMRAVAAECQDPAYMALFGFDENGKPRDAHMDMAQVYFGERTPDARNRTKAINHKINYGGSAASTAAQNGIPIEVVNAALLERSRAYPRLIEWTGEVRERGGRGELLDNGFGRKMRCDPQRAWTQAPALIGQGAARDIVCEAILRFLGEYPHATPYLRGVVHDELVLSVPEAEAEFWREALRWAFTFTWKDVPILCDVSPAGRNWAECYAGE